MLAIGSASYNSEVISTIYLVDAVSFKVLQTLELHKKGVQTMAFSSDNRYLVSAAGRCDNSIGIWDIKTGELVRAINSLTLVNDIVCREYVAHHPPIPYLLEFVSAGRNVLTIF